MTLMKDCRRPSGCTGNCLQDGRCDCTANADLGMRWLDMPPGVRLVAVGLLMALMTLPVWLTRCTS